MKSCNSLGELCTYNKSITNDANRHPWPRAKFSMVKTPLLLTLFTVCARPQSSRSAGSLECQCWKSQWAWRCIMQACKGSNNNAVTGVFLSLVQLKRGALPFVSAFNSSRNMAAANSTLRPHPHRHYRDPRRLESVRFLPLFFFLSCQVVPVFNVGWVTRRTM